MDRQYIVRKLIVKGSDDLVEAVYRRIRADRVALPGPCPGIHPAATWGELAARAVAEGILSRREARSLRRVEAKPASRPS